MVSIAGKCGHARLSSCPFVTDSVQLSRIDVDLFNLCAWEFVCVCVYVQVCVCAHVLYMLVVVCVCVLWVRESSCVCEGECVCVCLYSVEVRSIAVCGGTLHSGINMKSYLCLPSPDLCTFLEALQCVEDVSINNYMYI